MLFNQCWILRSVLLRSFGAFMPWNRLLRFGKGGLVEWNRGQRCAICKLSESLLNLAQLQGPETCCLRTLSRNLLKTSQHICLNVEFSCSVFSGASCQWGLGCSTPREVSEPGPGCGGGPVAGGPGFKQEN